MENDVNLRDLSRSCFVAVGPARIAACALTLLTDDTSDADMAQTRYEMSTARVRTAKHMLAEVFPDQLAKASHTPSPELETTRLAALECMKPLAWAVEGPLVDLDRRMGGRASFRDYFFSSAERIITQFLEVITADLTQTDTQRHALHRAQTLTSVENASGVGRAISMIAVNASIEASRSGNRGFRVITDEIKHLASQTQKILGEVADGLRHQ